MRRSLNVTAMALVLALARGTVAMASGGGGGGMSASPEAPSASAPRYDPAAEYAKAIAALKAGQFRAAASAAQHVTDAAPRNADGWRLLGAARAGDNDWRSARRAYERAVRLVPDDIEAHGGLGLALANLKDPKSEAELGWLRSRAESCGTACPNASQLQALSAAIQRASEAGPRPSASNDRSLLFSHGDGDVAYVTAVSLINERRFDEALASLDAASAALGPHPDILTYQGYAWRKKGDYARAEGYYRQALAIDPRHIGAIEYYGELKVARGDLPGARLMLARLDRLCAFGCADAEELRRWIDAGRDPGRP